MLRSGLFGVFFVFLLAFVGCRSGSDGGHTLLPTVTGKPGQVLVVSPTVIVETPLGLALREVLEAEYLYIPQSEPSFDLTFITDRAFTTVLQTFRNIIWLVPHADSAQCSLGVATDRWAAPQSVFYLSGPDIESIAGYVRESGSLLYQALEQAERDRLFLQYAKLRNEVLSTAIADRFGYPLTVPAGYQIRRDTADFLWVSLETPDISQGLIIHKMPDRGDAFSLDTILSHRDYWTSRFVPGPTDGTYMVVGTAIPPDITRLHIKGDTLERVRGFWEVHGHAMGGSFLSYSRRTSGGDSVVTVGGYIYAPRFKKRDYVRELEAILLSGLR